MFLSVPMGLKICNLLFPGILQFKIILVKVRGCVYSIGGTTRPGRLGTLGVREQVISKLRDCFLLFALIWYLFHLTAIAFHTYLALILGASDPSLKKQCLFTYLHLFMLFLRILGLLMNGILPKNSVEG